MHRYIDQDSAVRAFVDEYGPGSPTPEYVTCPMPNKDTIASHPETLGADEATLYRSKLGACNYFVSTIRYDIAHAVSRVRTDGSYTNGRGDARFG